MTQKQRTSFDQFSEDYSNILDGSISISGESSIFFVELKIKLLREYFQSIYKSPLKILDYGCGTGRTAHFTRKYFPNSEFFGVDISEKSIEVARKSYPECTFSVIDPAKGLRGMNFKNKFDIVFSAVVFHHITPKQRKKTFEQIFATLKNRGYFVLFEHNPYNPVIRKIVKDCPFDKDAVLMKPEDAQHLFKETNFTVEKQIYYFFFPQFFSFLRWCEKFLTNVPLGAQYMIIGRKED